MTTTRSAYNNPRHPAYLRVWLYAMDHDGQALSPCQLRDATNLEARTLSRGLAAAKSMGLLTASSNARHLTVRHLPNIRRASA